MMYPLKLRFFLKLINTNIVTISPTAHLVYHYTAWRAISALLHVYLCPTAVVPKWPLRHWGGGAGNVNSDSSSSVCQSVTNEFSIVSRVLYFASTCRLLEYFS